MISIVVRTKNEERWISQCIKNIRNQTIQDIEIILVDNKSTDGTVKRALREDPSIILVEIDEFLPGKAINDGIRASSGDLIAIISAHCIPVDEYWLENLVNSIGEPHIAGVYGRQVPMSFTNSTDKRDLLVTFGLDRREQKKDCFFHNASSLIKRSLWEEYPFDELVTNIEDRVWGKQVIAAGYSLIYEPESTVLHYHGIHQNNDSVRATNVIRIMESLESYEYNNNSEITNPNKLQIAALIPIRYEACFEGIYDELISRTLTAIKNSKYIDRIIVSTDSSMIKDIAIKYGAEVPFSRPDSLSDKSVRVDEVLKYMLEKLEENDYYPDVVVPLEITNPFRPAGLLDSLVEELLETGVDSIISGVAEYRVGWRKKNEEYTRFDEFNVDRVEREPIHVGLLGLGCATYPEIIRDQTRIGKRVGIFELNDPIASIEIREKADMDKVNSFIHGYDSQNDNKNSTSKKII